jgi:hypothetical protein
MGTRSRYASRPRAKRHVEKIAMPDWRFIAAIIKNAMARFKTC